MSADEAERTLQQQLWELAVAVTDAPTRQAIDTRVCDGVLATDRYDSVWICSSPPGAEPRAAAGWDLDAVDQVHEDVESAGSSTPWGRAGRELAGVAETAPESVREGDLALGCVPLTHRRINYGVLTVASEGTPTDRLREDLEPLVSFGQIVGHALATDELQTHGEIFRQAIEQAEPAIAILDDEGTVEYANAAFESVFGYTKSEVVGSSLPALVSEIPRDLAAAVEPDLPWRDEVVHRGTSERETHVDLSIAAVTIEGGTRSKHVAAATDITPIREREQRLQVLNRFLRHNLRNDLNVVQGHLELALDVAPAEVEELLETAKATTSELVATAETSRSLQSKLSETEPHTRDARVLLDDAIGRIRAAYPDHDVTVSGPESLLVTAVDGVEDALFELLKNACVHGGEPIRARVERDDESVVIEISDDGPGIPAHELAVVESGQETPLEHGSGLGLWFVSWVVRACGGGLTIDTETGTTVSLTLHTPPE